MNILNKKAAFALIAAAAMTAGMAGPASAACFTDSFGYVHCQRMVRRPVYFPRRPVYFPRRPFCHRIVAGQVWVQTGPFPGQGFWRPIFRTVCN